MVSGDDLGPDLRSLAGGDGEGGGGAGGGDDDAGEGGADGGPGGGQRRGGGGPDVVEEEAAEGVGGHLQAAQAVGAGAGQLVRGEMKILLREVLLCPSSLIYI